ncbi:uncharacterized protein LY89DRAFT_777719 [Mollisia scopiformis]|uniref:Uncharacterized protein n=1 Tax=Mollisia scopiformis TaxID=149040 RepID=A0A194XR83_MOLSC|nr:uncharacterized protein LY89DRAFT_777719 [Mollisia scopiformis]KUJ22661.1 hypothetical protein LY89DRAFT_777719 [Mollisia scopiformis]
MPQPTSPAHPSPTLRQQVLTLDAALATNLKHITKQRQQLIARGLVPATAIICDGCGGEKIGSCDKKGEKEDEEVKKEYEKKKWVEYGVIVVVSVAVIVVWKVVERVRRWR